MTRRKQRGLSGADAIPAVLKKSKRGPGFKGQFLIVLSGDSEFTTIDSDDVRHVGLVEVEVTRRFADGRSTRQKFRSTSISHVLKALAERFNVEEPK